MAPTATSNGTGQFSGSPTANPAAQPVRASSEPVRTALRERRSASRPANPDASTYGRKPRATVTDTHQPERVRSSTSMPSARVIISWATVPVPWAVSSSRKGRTRSADR